MRGLTSPPQQLCSARRHSGSASLLFPPSQTSELLLPVSLAQPSKAGELRFVLAERLARDLFVSFLFVLAFLRDHVRSFTVLVCSGT